MYEKLFSIQEETLKVLANNKRLEIIQLLSHGELSVSQMVEMLGIRQANLSQHLSLLRQAKLVNSRREGVTIFYQLTDPSIAQASAILRKFLIDQHSLDPDIAKLAEMGKNQLYPIVKDVVCGMRMSPNEVAASSDYKGERYCFCGQGCRAKFEKSPVKFATNAVKEEV